MDALVDGFAVALDPMNLVYVTIGALVGMIVGALPGLGPSATIALMLPITMTLPPDSSIILLAGIYYGAMYGGTLTSVLVRIPGEAATIITMLEGYQMAQKGRAGPALGISAIGSFVGGTLATLALVFMAPVMTELALSLDSPNYFALALLGLVMVTLFSPSRPSRAVLMCLIGVLIGTIGSDPVSGAPRFTWGVAPLFNGVSIVVLAMGLFGLAEVFTQIERSGVAVKVRTKVGRVLPTRQDMKDSAGPIARGSITGTLLGVLPGGGGFLAAVGSYALERRVSRGRDKFGHGAIEGVAGPETANNAGSVSSFVPMLTLGIPANPVMALMLSALVIQGVTPGPNLVNTHPEIFWGVIASMFIGNVILLIFALPLVGLFIQILRIPMTLLAPIIMIAVVIGLYTLNNSTFDVVAGIMAGVVGYLMSKRDLPVMPLIMGVVFGPILEISLRQSLLISHGSYSILFSNITSIILLALSALTIIGGVVSQFRSRSKPRVRSSEQAEMVESSSTTGTHGG